MNRLTQVNDLVKESGVSESIEIRLKRVAVTLAEELSFARAAARLNILDQLRKWIVFHCIRTATATMSFFLAISAEMLRG